MSKLFCLLLTVFSFSLMLSSAGTLNDTAVFDMDIDSGNWDVIIRNVNEAEFAERYGTTYDSVHDYLVSTNTYINAVHKSNTREITVRKTGVNPDSVGSFENLISLSAKEKNEFAEKSGDLFVQQGGENEFSGIYRHPQTDFLVYDMTYKSGEPDEYYGIRYYTVVNGINIYIDYYSYKEKITAGEKDELAAIIDTIKFKDVDARSDKPAGKLVILCAGGTVAAVLSAALIIAKKAKKKRSAALSDNEDAEERDEDAEEQEEDAEDQEEDAEEREEDAEEQEEDTKEN